MDKSARQTNTALLCSWTNQPDKPALPFCDHGQISTTNQHCPFLSMDKSARQINTALLCRWTNKPDKATLPLFPWTNQPDKPTLPFCVHGQISPTNQHCFFVTMEKSARQTNAALLWPWTNQPDKPTLPFCVDGQISPTKQHYRCFHGQISPTNQHCPFLSMEKSARQTNTALLCPWKNQPDKPTLPFCVHGKINPTNQHCPFVSMDK